MPLLTPNGDTRFVTEITYHHLPFSLLTITCTHSDEMWVLSTRWRGSLKKRSVHCYLYTNALVVIGEKVCVCVCVCVCVRACARV